MNKKYVSVLEFPVGIIVGNHKIYGIGFDSVTGEVEFLTETDKTTAV